MRAEEGDETVKDYAAEGKQALGRIKASQRAGAGLATSRRGSPGCGEATTRRETGPAGRVSHPGAGYR